MEIYRWQEIETERQCPLQSRQVLHTQQATIVRLVTKKGMTVPMHHHANEQIVMLQSGAFRFDIEGQSTVLKRGDMLRIPSNVPHQAEALDDSVTIEVFVPPRLDWIREREAGAKK
jgi:quercetin dioxygenase-like cupin family protein